MILKIIALVFGYLLGGVGVLELIRLHDRHTDWIHQWLDRDDELEQVSVVILWPFALVYLLMPWLIGKFVFAFIKVVQIMFTALAYMIAALIKDKEQENEP